MGILGPPARAWRGARSSVRAALAIALLGWAALASAQDSAPRSVTLDIIAGEDWAASGIEVRPDDTVAIEAGDAPARPVPISPDGSPDSTGGNVVEPKLPHAALIGRIGEGPIFLVGARFERKMDASGPLRLRWNLLEPLYANLAPHVFAVDILHTPAPIPDPDEDEGNSTAIATNSSVGNVSVAKAPVETEAPPRRSRGPGKAQREAPLGPAPSLFSAMGFWLLWLFILLVVAGAAVAVQRGSRARTVKRTRSMLGLSPSLDLAEGRCGGDDLPAEGPAASLRARLDLGVARMKEGNEHG
jgi:hypothetical protein